MVFDTQMAIHRRVVSGVTLLLLALVLVACSGGASARTTLHMKLTDEFGAFVGGELLGSAEQGVDQLVGDLAQSADGTWRGVVTGTAKRTISTKVMGTDCNTELSGTQQIEVVGTPGSYGNGKNLRLAFSPVKPPSYDTVPLCDQAAVQPTAKNGIEWLAFYFDAYQDAGLDVHLPDKPGGTWTDDHAQTGPDPCKARVLQIGCARTTTLTVEYHEPAAS